jgi:hypothetical protein
MLVTFFDPHPGLMGALAPIPEPVRLLAQELDGKTLQLEDALQRISAACPEGIVEAMPRERAPTSFLADLGDRKFCYISLKMGSIKIREDVFLPQHSWRVIKYNVVGD